MSDTTRRPERAISKRQAPPKKAGDILRAILQILLCALAVLVCRLVSWVFHNWGNLQTDELIYTMTASLEGTNPATIRSAVTYVLPPTLLAAALAALLSFLLRRLQPKSIWQKRLRRAAMPSLSCLSALAILCSLWYFAHRIGVAEYIRNEKTYSSFIEDNYVAPDAALLTFPEQKRNLVYLFIESMEMTFADPSVGGGKPVNVIPELTQISLENENFSGGHETLNGGYALYGASYTMAGLFAQTSGLPLRVTSNDLALTDGFLPGLTVLGDILEDAGYRNVFCLGTVGSFGERDSYFLTHGNHDILDYTYSINTGELPADYSRDWWGYDDYILYENAKKHLTELAAAGEPFSFTMLTVDTHAEDGYICALCGDDFDVQYSNAFACASTQAAEFVEWIQQQDFYENTTIVINGDHCTMDSDYCTDIPEDYFRRTYTAYINAAASPVRSDYRIYCTMDNFPTTLAALGVEIEGDRLGLGTNLFSARDTLAEEHTLATFRKELAYHTDFFDSLLGAETDRDVVLSYDDESGLFTVSVGADIAYDDPFEYVYFDLTHGDTVLTYTLSSKDGRYEASIPLNTFSYSKGTYTADIYLMLPDGLSKLYASEELALERITHKTSKTSVKLSRNGETLTVTYKPSAQERAAYSNFWFAVWSVDGGMDDLWWFDAEPKKSGTWICKIDPLEHTSFLNDLELHIYGGNPDAADFLSSTAFYLDPSKMAKLTDVSSTETTLSITYHPKAKDDYSQYWFAVWSVDGNAEDLTWFAAGKKRNGTWHADITLSEHPTYQERVNIHIYGETASGEMEILSPIVYDPKAEAAE